MLNVKNYLINGSTENWHKVFEYNPPHWGFSPEGKSAWDALHSGDIIYFYASKEAKGIIGKGLLLSKFHGIDPIWPREIRIGSSKWPWRFYFKPINLLPPDLWKEGKGPLPSSEFDMMETSLKGKHIVSLNTEHLVKIKEKIFSWPTVSIGRSKSLSKNTVMIKKFPAVECPANSHTRLIEILEEMGKLQNFYPQTEFSIPDEKRKVDVIWRREIQGTPTYAFEIELSGESGEIKRALQKLDKCYQRWNTLPRIITPSSEATKVSDVASSLGLKDSIIAITPELIKEIYSKKKKFKDMEKEVGLL